MEIITEQLRNRHIELPDALRLAAENLAHNAQISDFLFTAESAALAFEDSIKDAQAEKLANAEEEASDARDDLQMAEAEVKELKATIEKIKSENPSLKLP